MPDTPADLLQRWFIGGVAACCGEAATFPLDFTKTRLQLQNELGRALGASSASSGAGAGAAAAKPPPALGMFSTVVHIARTEGVLAMYGGLGVEYTPEAEEKIAAYTAAGYAHLPVCMAKTQYR